ncbi:PorV/PorQ family protein [Candidatus Eisenbacteria bacterium]|uniref:PorV/PorQ family protein n=1 Tax=Eiseniibacteriota bacterium TaxID=2212470 RepID=A0ABV6YP37_UNCEI
MRRTAVIALLLVVMLAGLGWTQSSERAGSVGVLFLKLGTSPRVAGMGNAYVGVADDISGIFLNPASIVQIEGQHLFFSSMQYMVDMNAMSAVWSFPIQSKIGGRLAVHYTGLYSGDMTWTTADDIDGTQTAKNFTWNELALGVTYGRMFTDRFSIGMGAKYVRTDVADWYSHTVAFDVGTLYKTGWRNLRLGMSVTNFGPDMQFKGTYSNTWAASIWQVSVEEDFGDFALPLTFQVGIADELYMSGKSRLTGALDYSHPNDLAERLHLGAEYAYDEMVFLRAGYLTDVESPEIREGDSSSDSALNRYWEFRLGGGVIISNFVIDYAWQSIEDLEDVHRFSLGYSF